MTDVAVKVEGLNALVRTMNKAKRDISELKDAHERVGRIVAGAAQTRAPRRSGRLAGSVRPTRAARRARIVAGRSSIPYAAPIHWGWPSRGIAANPFMSDAATDTESTWVPIYRKDVERALDQVRGV